MTAAEVQQQGTILDALTPAQNWYHEFDMSFNAGIASAFVLSGDIHGLNTAGVTHRGFLLSALSLKYPIVLVYNRTDGFSFPELRKNVTGKSSHQLANEFVASALIAKIEPKQPATRRTELMQKDIEQNSDIFEGVQEPSAALRRIEQLLLSPKAKGQVAVVIDHAEHVVPNQQDKGKMTAAERDILITLLKWGRDKQLAGTNNPIFLIAAKIEELHSDLRASSSGYRFLEVLLPVQSERLAFIERYLNKRKNTPKSIPLCDGLSTEELSNTTAGLNLNRIEDILLAGYNQFQKASASGSTENAGVTRYLVKHIKERIIRTEYSRVAQMIDPLRNGFDALGGADDLIAWARHDIIDRLQRGGRNVKRVPKAVLLVGPPGTGKTHFVKALAHEVGYNAVALNAKNFLGSLVGESERLLDEFFKFAVALAPTLILVDEIDQTDMARRGTNSGNPVAANLFNQVLQFLSDESLRGRVIVFLASNRPDLIDDAMKRSGRIDAIIPVLLPEEDARRGIILAQANEQEVTIEEQAVHLIASRTTKYSAADLASVIRQSVDLAEAEDRTHISVGDAELALGYIRANTPYVADYYTNLAIQACNNARFLPPQYATKLDDRQELQREIVNTNPFASEEREGRE